MDIVVRGEGELIVKDLANALALNRLLDNVAGITYSVNGLIINNPDGKVIDLDAIPIALPYELLQWTSIPLLDQGAFMFKQAEAAHTDAVSATTQSSTKTVGAANLQSEWSTKSNIY